VIIITSPNSVATLLLYRCLQHSHTEHELRTIFMISTSSKTIETLRLHFFENFLTNENFSFLLISCTRNRHSTVIESYIRRDDVIRCELDLALTEQLIHCLALTDCVAKDVNRLSQIAVAKRSAETIIIRSLERRETEQICFWLMILLNDQLSFDR
jgi:hypothetical protein